MKPPPKQRQKSILMTAGESTTHQWSEFVLKAGGSWEGADAGHLSASSAGDSRSHKTRHRPERSRDANRRGDKSFLIAGHCSGLVVGSLPNTCTITSGFWNPWSPYGQPSEQLWCRAADPVSNAVQHHQKAPAEAGARGDDIDWLTNSVAIKVTWAYRRRFRGSRKQCSHIEKDSNKSKGDSDSLFVSSHRLWMVKGIASRTPAPSPLAL